MFFRDLQAAGRSASTLRSYGMDLLRWFRFLWAVEVSWDRATSIEARDFSRWIQLTAKPRPSKVRVVAARRQQIAPGSPNPVTGKLTIGAKYKASTIRHSETVLRSFYDLHLELGSGPVMNPFPLHRSRRGGRAHAHHNPLQPFKPERSGRYRPSTPKRLPKAIPDRLFDELFVRLGSNRDRALVAMWISSGVRASELLGLVQSGVEPGRQLITVQRKGSRAIQQVPVSTDSFVWLRLYQQEMHGWCRPAGTNRCGGRCADRSGH